MANLQSVRASKIPIDLRSALASTLRTWLTLRDNILWAFCSGKDPDDRLEKLTLDGLQVEIEQVNYVRELCLNLAEQASVAEGKTPTAVLNEVIDQLLSAEIPKFLLSTQSVPGTF
jgi:hypothetical protein